MASTSTSSTATLSTYAEPHGPTGSSIYSNLFKVFGIILLLIVGGAGYSIWSNNKEISNNSTAVQPTGISPTSITIVTEAGNKTSVDSYPGLPEDIKNFIEYTNSQPATGSGVNEFTGNALSLPPLPSNNSSEVSLPPLEDQLLRFGPILSKYHLKSTINSLHPSVLF